MDPSQVGGFNFERRSTTDTTTAGSATAMISNPLWVVQTRQTAKTNPKSIAGIPETSPEALRKLSVLEAARMIIRKEGISSLWAGVGPALILVINPVLQVRPLYINHNTQYLNLPSCISVYRFRAVEEPGHRPPDCQAACGRFAPRSHAK